MKYPVILFITWLFSLPAMAIHDTVMNVVYSNNDFVTEHLYFKYTGKLSTLENEISKRHKGPEGKKSLEKRPGVYEWKNITEPYWVGSSYSCKLEFREKNGIVYAQVSYSDHKDLPILNKPATMRMASAFWQSAIEKSLNSRFTERDEHFNTVYQKVYEPTEEALRSYLFFYTRENGDSVLNRILEQFVPFNTGKIKIDQVNENTVEIQGLQTPALGYGSTYSLFVQASKLANGSTQYLIWAANFDAAKPENNYELRIYDLHFKLRRIFQSYLFSPNLK